MQLVIQKLRVITKLEIIQRIVLAITIMVEIIQRIILVLPWLLPLYTRWVLPLSCWLLDHFG